MVAVVAAASGGTGVDDLSAFGAGAILSQWGISPVPLVVTAPCPVCTPSASAPLRRRGDHWPVGRSVAWGCGMLAFYLATSSGLAAYDTVLLSVHMVQHMVLSMIVPLSLACSAHP